MFRVTDAAGCSLHWNESTYYVRAIAVFKISLTLCLSICRAFGQIGKGKPRGRRQDWLVVIYKHCALLLPFPRLKHKRLDTRCVCVCVFFFTPAFSLRLFVFTCTHTHSHRRTQSKPASTPPFSLFSLFLSHTHTVHAYTHPGSPWLLNCHCSEITASRTRQSGSRAGS